jgi:glycosyltransferase involved in cell wall biosynthesis
MGKPLVLTDIRGCREVVRDGVNGFLVPPGQPDALAETIERLVSDDELRSRLGAASRERSIREFDERSVVARTIGVYDTKLAKGRGRR